MGYFQLVRKPKVVIPPPPPPPVGDLGDKSFLNIWMDTINRQHSKHKSMYTFVCGQQFRRDEHGKGNEHCVLKHDTVRPQSLQLLDTSVN